MRYRPLTALMFVVLATAAAPPPAAAGAAPGAASVRAARRGPLDAQAMDRADRLIDDAIARGDVPGAVLLVGRADGVLYRKAFGNRAVEPKKESMKVDTIFDMASLSKPVGCATSVMILVERGKIDPKEKVAKYLPDFARNGKEDVTVEQLLLHWSGLIPDNDLADYKDGPAAAIDRVYALKPRWTPGTHFAYSDVGFIVLGELVRKVDGRPLDQFAKDEVFGPLGMSDTAYNPPAAWHDRCAPTEKRNGHWMTGEVHDPRAYALGGVAGHAGVFSSADDLARWCRMLLNGGELDGKRILKESTVRDMARPRKLPDGTGCRGLGLDVDTGYSSCRGERFPVGTSFGHTGFTGTMFWIDPADDCFFVLLTNSVHPDGKGKTIALRKQVATAVGEALLGPGPTKVSPTTKPGSEPVLAGIDVLKADGFKALDGRRVALVTNHTGLDRDGNRTVDLLAAAKGVKLVKLFSPEHGLFGLVDEKVSDTTDPKTGLKVYSLYGKTQKPTPEMLEGVDTIVFDIQDVGARYYTYVSTMGLCMEAAATNKVKMVVLDRPCPITGLLVDGPLADKAQLGFIAYAPIPVAHGMTAGELARLFNAEQGIGCDLTVVPVKNWRRGQWWDETGLMWVNPSPNMRNPTQALLYLAVGQLEAANLSVGRGTDQPFEVFGAPWVDGRKLAAELNAAGLPGLRFTPITFKPASSKFAGKECQGVYIAVTDRETVEPVRAGLAMAWHLKRLFGEAFEDAGVGRMVRNAEAMEALKKADDPGKVAAVWEGSLAEFKKVRQKYLMYE